MKNGKLKRILTSRITVGIICFLLGGIVFGGSSKTSSKQVSNKQVATEENSSQSDSKDTTKKEEKSQSDTKKDDKSQNKNSLKEMKLGETETVTTSKGDYKFSIEGIRFTDERNRFSEKPAELVFFLDFNYENVSSTDEVYLFDSNFKIMDDQGTVLGNYPVNDKTRRSERLPIGGKCSSSATYAMPTTSKTLKVLFYDNMYGKPMGEMTIETGL